MSEQRKVASALQNNPVAIVGLAGIFPQAENLQEYWDNIVKEVDSITEVPSSRWQIEDYYDPDPRVPDKTYCKRGGFIPDIDFNPMEFGLPPNILEVTDVSQLLSLVVARQAMNDAGYGNSVEFDRDRTGIVLGVGGGQKLITPLTSRLQYPVWERVLESSGIPETERAGIIEKMKKAYIRWEENSFPGMLGNVISGRIANRLDLGGMNCVVDAACAASLAAVKMAVTELTDFRADTMITGGVDTDNSIFMYMSFSKTPAFSQKNDIRPFDADSDGMMIGEGIGMLVLKRLADAERDGDRIYAVIKGIGTSSDGRYKSIYAPRSSGQALAVNRAYEDAGFEPASVGLVEAHGTGTPAGDPTEFAGLKEVFGHNNPKQQHIAIGSVKSQIGHTKAAAGAASLIKTALALHHQILPPTLNVSQPNPKLDIENSPFYLNTHSRPWLAPPAGTPRRAGVSAFGFGGTNFHFALEEYLGKYKGANRLHTAPEAVFLSAPSPRQLQHRCEKELAALRGENGAAHYRKLTQAAQKPDIPATAARLGFVSESREQAIDYLQTAVKLLKTNQAPAWDHPRGLFYRESSLPTGGKVVALFPGQGSQYLEMGKELALNFPPLRDTYAEMDRLFVRSGQAPLSTVLFPIPVFSAAERQTQREMLRRTEFVQPAIGAFSVGLYKMLQQAGFNPDFVAGHSFGELTALWAGGVLDDAAYFYLARARGEAMAAPADPAFDAGTMLAVKGNTTQLQIDIQELDGVRIANFNSNEQIVLAGSTPAMEAAHRRLEARGYVVTPLPVSAAFHTPFVAHAQQPFAEAINRVSFSPPRIPVYGNSSSQPYPTQPEAIQGMLREHILKPVLFRQEIENIYAAGGTIFVEIGPRRVLTNLVHDILGERPHVTVALNASKSKGSDRQLREAYVQLCVVGLPLRTFDPYAREFKSLTSEKKSIINVRLGGHNYVSPQTEAAYEKALQNGGMVASSGKSSPASNPAQNSPPAAAGNAAPAADAAPASRVSRAAPSKPDPQTETRATVTPAAAPAPPAASASPNRPLNSRRKATQPPAPSPKSTPIKATKESKSMSKPSNFQERVEKSLDMLHQQQAETARVHELFLKGQETYIHSVVELVQQSRAAGSGAGGGTSALVSTAPVGKPEVPAAPRTNGFAAREAAAIKPAPAIPSPPAPAAAPAPPPPASSAAAAPETAVAPPLHRTTAAAQIATTAQTPALATAMLAVVSEKTGYPVEMLEMHMDMESDLGIDSIKRVEILGAMQKRHPDLPEVNPAELAELRTLQQIVDHLQPAIGQAQAADIPAGTPAPPAPAAETAAADQKATAAETAALAAAMLTVVSEKTGYPVEMLEMHMDMESDLGIDSIKRVEILGAMQKRHPDLPEVNPAELAELRTLQQIVDHLGMTDLGKADPATAGAGSNTNGNSVPAPTTHAVTRNLVTLKSLPMPDYLAFALPPTHCCLLTDDGTALTTAVAQRLTDRGWRVVVLGLSQATGAGEPALPSGVARVNLTAAAGAALQEELEAVAQRFGPIGTFIYLHPPNPEAAAPALKQLFFLAGNLGSSLHETALETRAAFLAVTHLDGALGLDGTLSFNPINGGLFGLSKTLNLEWPQVFCRAVDLHPGLEPQQGADYVLAELHDPDRLVTEVGYGSRGRVTLDTRAAPLTAYTPDGRISANSLFVVSGGAKGITAQCVRYLAQQVQCKFLLLGRSTVDGVDTGWLTDFQDEADLKRQIMQHLQHQGEKPTPMRVGEMARAILSQHEIKETLRAVQQAGGEAEYASVDVTNAAAVQAAVSAVSRRLGPVTGIIHGAGVLSDRLIEKKSEQDYSAVYATKVDGLHALLQAVPPQQLHHLVLFSSAAGFYGNVGQSDYALANEILNKTAHLVQQQHPDCHVVAINWGPWDGGMVTPALRQHFAERGVQVIPVEVGTWILARELTAANRHVTQTVVGGPLVLPDAAPDGDLRHYQIHRFLGLDANPFLKDHVIGGNPVLPAVHAIAWMGNACEQLYPGFSFFRCDSYQVLQGIVFEERQPLLREYVLDVTETEKDEGKIRCRVMVLSPSETGPVRYHYRADITLLAELPDAPHYNGFDLAPTHSIGKDDLYRSGALFHGPAFQSIEEILQITPQRVTMRSRLAPLAAAAQGQFRVQSFNPFIADGQLQSMVIWAHRFRQAGSLPLSAGRFEQYRTISFDQTTYITMEVKEASDSELVADIVTHDENGRLYTRIHDARVTISKRLNHQFVPAATG